MRVRPRGAEATRDAQHQLIRKTLHVARELLPPLLLYRKLAEIRGKLR